MEKRWNHSIDFDVLCKSGFQVVPPSFARKLMINAAEVQRAVWIFEGVADARLTHLRRRVRQRQQRGRRLHVCGFAGGAQVPRGDRR